MKEVILGIWLGIQGGIDLKYKEIPVWLIVPGAVAGLMFCILEQRSLGGILLACLPGVISIVFSKLTREVMGYGDGIVFLVMGTFLSLESLVEVVVIGFLIAGLVALVLLVVFRKKGNYRIPFLPFLCLAYGMQWWMV